MKIPANLITPPVIVQTSTPPVDPSPSPSDKPNPVALRIEISKEGRERLESEKLEAGKFADIDKAPLPEDVKEVLKNIRKLQEKIARISQELTDVMADKSLSDEERKRKQHALTAQLQSMQSALGDATSALNNAMSMHNLRAESRSLARGLVGMK